MRWVSCGGLPGFSHGAYAGFTVMPADMGRVLVFEIPQRAFHRVRRRLAEAAQAGGAHKVAQLLQGVDIFDASVSGGDPFQNTEKLGGADPAGRTFPAGFGHAELHEEFGHIHHAGPVVHDDHATGAHDGAHFPEGIVIHRHVQELFRHAAAGGTAGLDGLEPSAGGNPAADVENDLPQGGPHGHLDEPGVIDLAGQGEYLGALAFFRADAGEPAAAATDDGGDVGKRFHVVDQGRASPETEFGGKRRPGTRSSEPSLDGGDEGGLLAADKGAGPQPQLNVEGKGRVEDIFAENPQPLCLLDGAAQPLDGQGILGPHIDVAPGGAHGVAGDGHALDHPVGVALQNASVHERAGISLVGIADHVLDGLPRLVDRRPLQAGGKSGPAPAPKAAGGDLVDDLPRAHLSQGLVERFVATRGDIAFDAFGFDDAAVFENDFLLPGEKRLIGRQQQPGNRGAGEAADDLRGIGWLDRLIGDIQGGDVDERSDGTESQASDPPDQAGLFFPLPTDFFFKGCFHDIASAGEAAGGHADVDAIAVRFNGIGFGFRDLLQILDGQRHVTSMPEVCSQRCPA
ncbi:hypothetical protein DESC_780256 [Desulfosarcina cetonica]|nr:hypothetical protein DESC_780256 [Desulfosarcina cetonica]